MQVGLADCAPGGAGEDLRAHGDCGAACACHGGAVPVDGAQLSTRGAFPWCAHVGARALEDDPVGDSTPVPVLLSAGLHRSCVPDKGATRVVTIDARGVLLDVDAVKVAEASGSYAAAVTVSCS